MMIGASQTRSNNAERFVQNRRREESTVNNINRYLKSDMIARHIASWEDKGGEMMKSRFTKQNVAMLRAQYEQKIHSRRLKLKQLYDQEHEDYKAEMRRMRPSKDQIKQSMIDKVATLKKEREATNTKQVAQFQERRFKDQADELRKVDADIKEIKYKHERDIQMLEKQQRLEKEYMEDMIYAELWRRDMNNKYAVEAKKAESASMKNTARNQILDKQYQDLQRRKNLDLSKQQQEKNMLNTKWSAELQTLKEQEIVDKDTAMRLNAQIFRENKKYRDIKDEELLREKVKDKQMVEDILQREKMLDQLEIESKNRYKQETKDYLKNFKNRSDELKLDQDHLDKLLKEERDKQWQKRQDQWDKERNAQVKLIHEVYDDRARALYYKKDQEQEALRLKNLEREALTQSVNQYKTTETEKGLQEILRQKQHQNTILWQINEKEESRRRRILTDMEYERQKRLRELEYQMMIEREKEKGRKILEETKAHKLYQADEIQHRQLEELKLRITREEKIDLPVQQINKL